MSIVNVVGKVFFTSQFQFLLSNFRTLLLVECWLILAMYIVVLKLNFESTPASPRCLQHYTGASIIMWTHLYSLYTYLTTYNELIVFHEYAQESTFIVYHAGVIGKTVVWIQVYALIKIRTIFTKRYLHVPGLGFRANAFVINQQTGPLSCLFCR